MENRLPHSRSAGTFISNSCTHTHTHTHTCSQQLNQPSQQCCSTDCDICCNHGDERGIYKTAKHNRIGGSSLFCSFSRALVPVFLPYSLLLTSVQDWTYSKLKAEELPSVCSPPVVSHTLCCPRQVDLSFSSALFSPVFSHTLLFASSHHLLSFSHSLQISSAHQLLLLLQLAAARLYLLHVSA